MDTTQLKRIADALEEVLRLVKLDQEANEARIPAWRQQTPGDPNQSGRVPEGPTVRAAGR